MFIGGFECRWLLVGLSHDLPTGRRSRRGSPLRSTRCARSRRVRVPRRMAEQARMACWGRMRVPARMRVRARMRVGRGYGAASGCAGLTKAQQLRAVAGRPRRGAGGGGCGGAAPDRRPRTGAFVRSGDGSGAGGRAPRCRVVAGRTVEDTACPLPGSCVQSPGRPHPGTPCRVRSCRRSSRTSPRRCSAMVLARSTETTRSAGDAANLGDDASGRCRCAAVRGCRWSRRR